MSSGPRPAPRVLRGSCSAFGVSSPKRRNWCPPPVRAEGGDKLALSLRKAAHKALAAVEESIEGLRFNVALAKIYELVNTLGGALANEKALLAADGTAAAALERGDRPVWSAMMAPMTPHLAEESWAALGHDGLVAHADWPVVDRSLLVEDEVTMPVQVNGQEARRRDRGALPLRRPRWKPRY